MFCAIVIFSTDSKKIKIYILEFNFKPNINKNMRLIIRKPLLLTIDEHVNM